MAATNFTPIQLYYSTTASAAPVAGNLASGELAINITDGKLYYKDNGGIVQLLASSSGASGDVVGPASSTDNAISRFDGTTGKLIQNSVVTIADTTGNMAGVGTLGVGAITTSGALVGAVSQDAFNTVSTTLNIGGAATTLNIGAATGTLTVANATLAAKALTATAITNSALTATRLVYSGTAGLEVDSANLTFNGTDLTVSGAVNAGSINATTLDLTNLEVTNIKAKDGTASIALADTTGIATFSKATVISATDNTNAALRITQLGLANALLVEDSANPDSTPVVIDASGRVVVGYTAPITTYQHPQATTNFTPSTQIQGVNVGATIAATAWSNGGTTSFYSPAMFLAKSASATIGTQASVVSGEVLGTINFSGDDGSAFVKAAQIIAAVDGTPGTNDMPGRLTFSTTADGASSPTERMRINSVGNVGIGPGVALSNAILTLQKSITGSTTSAGIYNPSTIQSDVTSSANINWTLISTAASAFTLGTLRHYLAAQNTIGASSVVTNQYGFQVDSSLTGATNNFGFVSSIASGTNRYNFYAGGTADNYFAGSVGIGTTPTAGLKVNISGTASGATSTFGLFNSQTADPAVSTALHISFGSATTVSAGTLPDLRAFNASQGTFTGTVTNQYAFFVQGTFVGATNNYGVYSNIAAAANRWNFYATGTARNYMAADLTVNGATAIPAGGTAGAGLMVSTTANFGVFFGSGAPTLSAAKGSLYLRSDGTTTNDRMYVNTNGSTTWTNVVTAA
jgi:hypothetical protein